MQDPVINNQPDKKLSSNQPSNEGQTMVPEEDKLVDENKKEEAEEKHETEEEVKESFQDEDVPVEPVVGNDGLEVGGEG